MPLHRHLTRSLKRGYRQLSRSLEGVDGAEAALGADPGWRRYRFGIGLDGSIGGIIRHLAAWKEVAAEGLETGVFPDAETALPTELSWAELRERLETAQVLLERALEALPPEELEREVNWEGQQMTLADVFTHLLEHDQYHAGQINLLRQQRGHQYEE